MYIPHAVPSCIAVGRKFITTSLAASRILGFTFRSIGTQIEGRPFLRSSATSKLTNGSCGILHRMPKCSRRRCLDIGFRFSALVTAVMALGLTANYVGLFVENIHPARSSLVHSGRPQIHHHIISGQPHIGIHVCIARGSQSCV